MAQIDWRARWHQESGWRCRHCGKVWERAPQPPACTCGSGWWVTPIGMRRWVTTAVPWPDSRGAGAAIVTAQGPWEEVEDVEPY